jgi:two-component system alkaline phosphatase synthesis response regulator PhoP
MDSRAPGSQPVILVVDDDPDIRGILGILLARDGYEVVAAIDGQDALTLAAAHNVALVVVDFQMPRLEGDGFCRTYRERGGRAPIILISATDISPAAVKRFGADAYVRKPFEVDQLIETIDGLMPDR